MTAPQGPGNAVIGGAFQHVAAVSKTRPADTTAYTAGDVINESTSAGTVFTFTNCTRAEGGSGRIAKVLIDDSANQTTKLQAELWLFDTAPAAATIGYDNAAFSPTDAEAQTVVAIIPVSTSFVGNAGSGASGNANYTSGQVYVPFKCASASTTLYGVLVARNAYTPVSSEVFNVRLFIEQD